MNRFQKMLIEYDVRTGIASRPWLIVPVCSMLHITYAIGTLLNEGVLQIAALTALVQVLGPTLPWMLLTVAAIATIPMIINLPAKIVHLCLWPQQLVLFLTAVSVLQAAYNGHYPDGTMKFGLYIFVDQSWAVYLMTAHLIATIRNAYVRERGT
jgi:hypothetical protein